jgi:hypothetical protein
MMNSDTRPVWHNLVSLPKTSSKWVVLDNISYATSTIANVLDPSTKPLHGFWSHHIKYHGGRSIIPFDKPTLMGWIHQINACQLWAP